MIRNTLLVLAMLGLVLPPARAMAPPDRVFEVDVSLVSCAVCRPKIKAVLCAIDNVKDVEFNLETKTVLVTMCGDKELKKDALEKAFAPTKYIFRSVVEKKAAESKPAAKPKTS